MIIRHTGVRVMGPDSGTAVTYPSVMLSMRLHTSPRAFIPFKKLTRAVETLTVLRKVSCTGCPVSPPAVCHGHQGAVCVQQADLAVEQRDPLPGLAKDQLLVQRLHQLSVKSDQLQHLQAVCLRVLAHRKGPGP